MESRMDKYYKSDISDCSRSKRNSKLYKDIYGDYSNLERLPIPIFDTLTKKHLINLDKF